MGSFTHIPTSESHTILKFCTLAGLTVKLTEMSKHEKLFLGPFWTPKLSQCISYGNYAEKLCGMECR